MASARAKSAGQATTHILVHPDDTVGPGIAPDLLTFPALLLESARGLESCLSLPPVGNCTPP